MMLHKAIPATLMRKTAMPVLFLCLVASPLRAASPADVDAAIEKARHFLYSYQHPDGGWEGPPPVRDAQGNFAEATYGPQYGGATALITFALLASGESAQSEKVAKAIDFLTKLDTPGTYGVGIRCLVWDLMPRNKKFAELLKRDSQILLNNVKSKGDARGLYHYSGDADPSYDHSVSQFGVLGEWACADAGIELPQQYWAEVDRAWRSHQYADGSWSYMYAKPGSNLPLTMEKEGPTKGAPTYYAPTVSMTAAGIATLFLSHQMNDSEEIVKGNVYDEDIDRGVSWLSQHFNDVFDQNKHMVRAPQQYYTLFGVSRIAVAGGYKYLGDVDWFAQGSDYLKKTQAADGSWNGYGGPFPNTAFGTLFLSRGRSPVLLSKLRYDLTDAKGQVTPGNWNQHPRDAANLVHWVGRQIEKHLNWQVVDLKQAIDDQFDSRILYITGDQALSFPPEGEKKLRLFVEAGGLILGNASANSRAFTTSFTKLGQKLFPGYEFRELPPTHPIFVNQMFPRAKWSAKPRVMGLSNGVRELMLLIPEADAAKTWQIRQARSGMLELGGDIFLYTVDQQEYQTRGTAYLVKADPAKKAVRAGEVARIQYDGNWDPEPAGWRRIAAILHNDYQLDIAVKPVKLGDGALLSTKVAHLTGTEPLRLTDAQRTELKQFVTNGGTLIVDAAGGSSRFAESATVELDALFAQHLSTLPPLASDSSLLSPAGHPLGKVTYRRAAVAVVGNLDKPRVRAATISGRPAIMFSAEDLTGGLVGEQVDGIIGYSTQSATDIVCHLVSASIPK